jgi:hypothetical protein
MAIKDGEAKAAKVLIKEIKVGLTKEDKDSIKVKDLTNKEIKDGVIKIKALIKAVIKTG